MKKFLREVKTENLFDESRDLHKLKREELLEMMLVLSKENGTLHKENRDLKKQLEKMQTATVDDTAVKELSEKIEHMRNAMQTAAEYFSLSLRELNTDQPVTEQDAAGEADAGPVAEPAYYYDDDDEETDDAAGQDDTSESDAGTKEDDEADK